MRTRVSILALVVLLGACHPFAEPTPSTGSVSGTIQTALPVDGYVFLYAPSEGPPGRPAVPLLATGVSATRLERGDGHFVFPTVAPGAYRLTGFLDVDANFRADVDVLAQPTRGDHLLTAAEISVDAGVQTQQDLSSQPALRDDPPAFAIETRDRTITLGDTPLQPVSFTLAPTDAGVLPASHGSFAVSLVDANGDGVPDDLNGDGLPDLWPQAFLRFAPKPGQTVPVNDAGVAGQVVIPLLVNPGPALAALSGNPNQELRVGTLQLFEVPQAQAVFPEVDGGVRTQALGAIPVGDYELFLLQRTGQFWRVPNDLGRAADGGAALGQSVRVTVVHGS